MSLPRFYVPSLSSSTLELDTHEADHALRARRLSVGDEIAVFDGAGNEANARIASAMRSKATLTISDVRRHPRRLPVLTLAVALPKGSRQDFLIEKCTELGIAELVPLMTERSISSASEHKLERWRRTAIEAAKQSGLAWLPEFNQPEMLEEAIKRKVDHVQSFVAATNLGRSEAESSVPDFKIGRILAFIGPEGGWAEDEMTLLVNSGCQQISLGPNTLRIETAAITLASLIHVIQRDT